MNKTFRNYITRQIYAIRDMLLSLREVTCDNAELERLSFEAINALVDFEITLEKVNENKGGIENEIV